MNEIQKTGSRTISLVIDVIKKPEDEDVVYTVTQERIARPGFKPYRAIL